MSGIAPISGIHKANLHPFIRGDQHAPKSVKIAGDSSVVAKNAMKALSVGNNIDLSA